MEETLLPLSIRDVSPSPDAIRLTGTRPDGLPDGVHTGGAWLVGDLVYKPLDGRPYANCPGHVPTQEVECLEAMAGQPGFPRNWHVEEINGRRFLVRPKCLTIPDDIPYSHLNTNRLLQVEQMVRGLNKAGWELNDPISLAIAPHDYDPFILDLSAAFYRGPGDKGCYSADDEWRVLKFFEDCKADLLIKLRNNARHAVNEYEWLIEYPDYRHVYGSFNRPMSDWWATIETEHAYIQNPDPNWTDAVPHTWVVTKTPLPQDVIDKYELRWGWSPIHV